MIVAVLQAVRMVWADGMMDMKADAPRPYPLDTCREHFCQCANMLDGFTRGRPT